MSHIVESISGDRRIQLAKEEFVRPMSFGTAWNKIRIGMRLGLSGNSAVVTSLPFYVGVCKGPNTFLSDSTTDWFGAGLGQSGYGGLTWAFTAGTPSYYTGSSAGCSTTWKVGSTLTWNWGGGTAAIFPANVTTNCAQCFLDITKTSSTQWTPQWWVPTTAAAAQTHITESQFFLNMENETAPPNTASGGTYTWTYTGAGQQDSISIVWFHSWPVMEISTIAVCRFL